MEEHFVVNASTHRLPYIHYLNPFYGDGLYTSSGSSSAGMEVHPEYYNSQVMINLNGNTTNVITQAGSIAATDNSKIKIQQAVNNELNYTAITNPFAYTYTSSPSTTSSIVSPADEIYNSTNTIEQQDNISSYSNDSTPTSSHNGTGIDNTDLAEIFKRNTRSTHIKKDESKVHEKPYKRPRRRSDQIERYYNCSYQGCTKSYGTLNHLNAHVLLQNHGPRRKPNEFKEIKKITRDKRKEQQMLKTIKEFSKKNNLMFISLDSTNTPNGNSLQAGVNPNSIPQPIDPQLNSNFDPNHNVNLVFTNGVAAVPLDQINSVDQLNHA